MKSRFLAIAIFLLFSNVVLAQNVLQKKIKNSEAFRLAAEKLNLEPGSIHIVKTTSLIDNTGVLENITAESEYPELEIIAIAILESLPQDQAPKHNADKKQKITLPIQFQVETLKYREQRLQREARRKKKMN